MRKLLIMLLGCLLTTAGLLILKHSHTMTGGTAGLALSLSYWAGAPFSVLFFFLNIPFYLLSALRMGMTFTLHSLFCVTVLSALSYGDRWLPPFTLPEIAASPAGGLLIGGGLSILFMSGSSIGGANILALYLFRRFRFDPGKTLFLFDLLVILSGAAFVGLEKAAYSILSIAVTSSVVSRCKNIISRNKKSRPQPMASPSSIIPETSR